MSGEAGRLQQADAAVERLRRDYAGLSGPGLLRPLLTRDYAGGRIALASSFGAEAAVLLSLVAEIDKATPVLFLDTGKLFAETLAYRDSLVAELGLTDVRAVQPEPAQVARLDPKGDLWSQDHDACCFLRKVLPLEKALAPFDAWITGRKRMHGGEREALPLIEQQDGWVKINPLAEMGKDEIEALFVARGLPRHPLVEAGFVSLGCVPCTAKPAAGEGLRSGRWAGSAKTECGIHVGRDRQAKMAAAG